MASEPTADGLDGIEEGRYAGYNRRYWLAMRVDRQTPALMTAFIGQKASRENGAAASPAETAAGENVSPPPETAAPAVVGPTYVSGELQYLGPERTSAPRTGSAPTARRRSTRARRQENIGTMPSEQPNGAFFASFRGFEITGQEGPIEWVDPNGVKVPGRLVCRRSDPASSTKLTVTLKVESALGGLPSGTEVVIDAVKVSDSWRELGLEFELEEGVEWSDGDIDWKGRDGKSNRPVSVTRCLREAGFAVPPAVIRTTIPAMTGGWEESDLFATLDGLSRRNADSGLEMPGFDVRVLMLSRTNRDDLLGVMFDNDCQPRQVAAVFVNTIRALSPKCADRKVIETTIHEIGHALNLRHRFDREVRRSASTSFMNCDWRYAGVDHDPDGPSMTGSSSTDGSFVDEPGLERLQPSLQGGFDHDPATRMLKFWKAFDFTFDPDELKFLRHAPRAEIVPGGAPFGSAIYWPTGERKDDAGPFSKLRLWLTSAGASFACGQPGFLEVSLLNTGSESVLVPRHVLDVKAGQLDILIRPWTPKPMLFPDRIAASKPFRPISRRCFDIAGLADPSRAAEQVEQSGRRRRPTWVIRLGRGESLHTNVNLAYGAVRSDMAEPGTYEVIPTLTFPPQKGGWEALDHVLMGEPLLIRIEPPRNKREERDGETLYRHDVGCSIALGGSTSLQNAADDLEELRRRRERDNRSNRPDPVVAALARCAGIQAYRHGHYAQAARLLEKATAPEALAAFDPQTAEDTKRLAERLQTRELVPSGTIVVVDLWTHPKRGRPPGPTSGGRGAGLLVVDPPETAGPAEDGSPSDPESTRSRQRGAGWAVLAPASQLPADAMKVDENDVFGEVIVAAGDGLTERITATEVVLVSGPSSDAPSLAILTLARSIPADPTRVRAEDSRSQSNDPSEIFGTKGTQLADRVAQGSEAMSRWAGPVDGAIGSRRERLPGTPAVSVARPGFTLDEVAGWGWPNCLPFWGCEPPPPGEIDESWGCGGGSSTDKSQPPDQG